MPQNHIIIFSHGFGVKKDGRGLFTDIANALSNIKSSMFDYNDIDEENNLVIVKPFSEQVKIFEKKLKKVRTSNSNAIVDIVCHSQGAIAVALAKPVGVRKIVLIAPPATSSIDRMVKIFQSRPGTVIDMQGMSKLSRADGSMTIIPPEYWKEREDIDPIKLYKELSQLTKLVIINAKQDEILSTGSFTDVKDAEIVNIDGDHNFNGESRKDLLVVVENIIIENDEQVLK